MAEDDVFCSACDCVLDVGQVLMEAEKSGEIDVLALSDDTGEEVLFDPDAAPPDDAARSVPEPLDADLAAELQSVLDDGTGTIEVPVPHGGEEPDAADLFDQPDASAEGEPVAPPPLDDTNPFGGSALIVGDGSAEAGTPDAWGDSTGAFPIEPAASQGVPSPQDLMAPTAVLSVHSPVPLAALQLSPIERHLVKLIDGKRPVLRVAKRAGVTLSDATTALRMLADRRLLRLVGHARLKGAPAAASPEPLPPMELPLDALTPLELPADALTPIDSPAPAPSPFDGDSAVRRASPTPFEGDSAIRRGSDGGGVRPAPVMRPAAAAGGPRKALVVKDLPSPTDPGGPHRPAASSMTTVKAGVDPTVQARAMQLIDVALKELRQNRKPTALSWVKMAADLLPNDARIQALLANWNEPVAKLIETASAQAAAPAPADDAGSQARALEAAGDAQGAANAYRRALKLNPNDAELYNRLGIVLALRIKDYLGASAALKKALELAPTNLAYRSNLGKIVKMAAGEKLADGALLGGDEAHKVKPEVEEKPASFLDRLKGLRKR